MLAHVKTQPHGRPHDMDLSGAVAEIEFLVKENEVLTGRPGRIFAISGSQRLSFKVYLNNQSFKVERLADGKVVDTQYLLPKAFARHCLPQAYCDGKLIAQSAFTTR